MRRKFARGIQKKKKSQDGRQRSSSLGRFNVCSCLLSSQRCSHSLGRECLANGVSAPGQAGVPHLTQQQAPLPTAAAVFTVERGSRSIPAHVKHGEGDDSSMPKLMPLSSSKQEEQRWLSVGGTAQSSRHFSPACFYTDSWSFVITGMAQFSPSAVLFSAGIKPLASRQRLFGNASLGERQAN